MKNQLRFAVKKELAKRKSTRKVEPPPGIKFLKQLDPKETTAMRETTLELRRSSEGGGCEFETKKTH
jgi:hypothetical protein